MDGRCAACSSGGYFNVSCGGTAPSYNAATKVLTLNCDYNADNFAGERALVPAFGNHLDLSRENLLVNGVFQKSDFPTPAFGSIAGMMSKDFFRGFGNWNLDLAASRNFRIPWFFGEKAAFQLRGEAFNAPNRVNLGGINTSLTSSTFGPVTSRRQRAGIRGDGPLVVLMMKLLLRAAGAPPR